MNDAFRAPDFGELLLERGLVSPEELSEAVRRQRRHQIEGRDPVPRLGELLVEMGVLTEPQVAQALEAQNKRILRCASCDVQVNVEPRPDVREYRCGRCGGLLEAPLSVRNVRVVDSSIILVGREALPPEVQEAAKDSSRKFGKYVLLGEIGRGGAAVVHRAWDTYLNQHVALKFIKPAGAKGAPRRHDSRILGLMHEARSAARLRHPNIVQVYEVGKIEGEFYIAMEFLVGGSLADLIRTARAEGKVSPFYDDPRRFLTYVRDVARAATYAHTRPAPIVHCDLKPSNVFISNPGRAYVLDFGLARELKRDADEPGGGIVRGTPAYMAPEQASGRNDEIDARTDVYGLGGILYELLAGRPPFTGDLFDVLHKAVSSMPVRPTEVVSREKGASISAALEAICLKCLEKDKSRRFASAKEVADDLDRLIRGEAGERKTTRRRVKTAPLPAVAAPPARRAFSWKAAGLAAVIAVLFGLSIGAAFFARPAPPSAPREALRERLDGLLAGLRTEEAVKTISDARESDDLRDWAEIGRIEVDCLGQLKSRLLTAINGSRTRIESLRTVRVELRDVTLHEATEAKLFLRAGEDSVALEWKDVEPMSFCALTEQILGGALTPSDRFGLALYCLKNRLPSEAKARFESLKSGDLWPFARRYVERLAD